MSNSRIVQLDSEYLENPATAEDEIYVSDDSEVSVANMNKREGNETPAEEEKKEDYSDRNLDGDNEIVSDEDYTYSEDSLCSDDSYGNSEITNVTPRSSLSAGSPLTRTMSLEFPVRRRREEILRVGCTPSDERLANARESIRRMCSSANESRYTIAGDPRADAIQSRARRRNMSFTNDEMRKIEMENQYLLKKIMAHQKPQNKPMRVHSAQPRVSSSAINRRKLQKKIEEENMMLLRRIQDAKSCALSTTSIPGYRVTSL